MLELNLKKYIKYSGVIGIASIFLLELLYYNIMFDILLIAVLFISSYLLGSMLLTKAQILNENIVKTVLGLGVLGIVFYFLLLFNIGKKSIFTIVLISPIILGQKYIKNLKFHFINSLPKTKKEHILFFTIAIFFMFYIAYGSAPISRYDALTKHLPITIYGCENGRFNYNVIESIVYGESMVMNYTYSIMFASFNGFKAITLFNVIISFFIFNMLSIFSKSIYTNTNILFLAIVYFSTPMFFEFSTVFYLDMLPIFFLLGAVLCYSNLKEKESWISLPVVAFLFGCSIFSKLTISYSVLVVGIIILALSILYGYKNKSIFETIKYFFGSFILFILPFIISVINIWYRTGNPLFPFYNNIFRSPYFPFYKFEDPFGVSPLGFTVSSLFKMIFQTSKNVEMHDGGLGFFMLLIFIIPIAIIINRSKKLIIWALTPFIIFSFSCLFTYNLRYNMAIFILLLSIVTISISIIFDRINLNINLKRAIIHILLVALFIPNAIHIGKYYNLKENLKHNEEITGVDNKLLMNEIPQNKKVLSLNDPFKGEYKGFFSAYMWHNSYNMDKVNNGAISIEDYISCFDYVIYQKGLPTYSPLVDKLINNAQNKESILIPYSENSTHILYKVKEKKSEIIHQEKLEKPEISKTSKPIIYKLNKSYDKYQITQDIENASDKNIEMRFQINWHNNEGKFLDTSLSIYTLKPGRNVNTSKIIPHYSRAAYGIVYITTNNDEEVLVHGYRIDGYESKGKYLTKELDMYKNRALLRK